MDHPYVVGGWNGFDSEPHYATLGEAAEAIRVAEGWTEIHLTDEGFTTSARPHVDRLSQH